MAKKSARKTTKKSKPKSTTTRVITRKKSTKKKATAKSLSPLRLRMDKMGITKTLSESKMKSAMKKLVDPKIKKVVMPAELKASMKQLRPKTKRFHGVKLNKLYFPSFFWRSKCKNTFCYLTPKSVRKSALPFNQPTIALLKQLGDLMGAPSQDTGADSSIPAGYTYFGQFVDHDITLDVTSSLDRKQDANKIENMRTPKLDLDSVYGRGPGLDPALYDFSAGGTAIKMHLGTNTQDVTGGPSATSSFSGMQVLSNFDVPRVNSTLTAVIGDPRNDENLIVSQIHHAILKFHNRVVDFLQLAGFPNDIFIEAKRIVTHHYQWVVVHDFLKRICGATAVNSALRKVRKSRRVCMPVEFSVAAYRFGHSMIRDRYWVNFRFPNATLGQVFQFVRNPQLPVRSSWVVDFNAFVNTGKTVPVNNKARKLDSALANGLATLPGTPPGFMGVLASRNLVRGLALCLPSGQATAKHLGVPVLTNTQLRSGLGTNEKALLSANGGLLAKKTPLWYYILREAKVRAGGQRLGPLGAKIVADTFVMLLKSDPDSFLNHTGGFSPSLPHTGTFDLADIIKLSGVNLP